MNLSKNTQNVFLIISILLFMISCDWPFNTDTTEEEIFNLTLNYNIMRVMPTAPIDLSWNEVTVEDFAMYKIERKLIQDSIWTSIAQIYDPFQLSYSDIINDDDDVVYRVGIFTIDDNIRWATTAASIPNTTNIIVPDEFKTIQSAFDSKLADSGDKIVVKDGVYKESLVILGKDIIIKSESGFKTTTIDGSGAMHTVGISDGTIEGFTIKGGNAFNKSGGGVLLQGTGVVRNCLIEDNLSNHFGGGLYIVNNGSVYNSIIYNNASPNGSGMFLRNAHGEIINNTVVGNDIVISGDCTGLLLRNNIINNSIPGISFADIDIQPGVVIDYSAFDTDAGIGQDSLTVDPELLDYLDFKLSPTSPCIDAGHPDNEYRDRDDSRNDIGAYGGQNGMQ